MSGKNRKFRKKERERIKLTKPVEDWIQKTVKSYFNLQIISVLPN